MRTYYHLKCPCDIEIFHTPDSITRNRRFKEFRRRYGYDGYTFDYSSCFKQAKIRGIYAYEENGCFYEFFSGCSLGNGRYSAYQDGNPESICFTLPAGLTLLSFPVSMLFARKLTASQFASDVEPYMCNQKKIGRMMQEFCEIIQQERLAVVQDAQRKREKKTVRDSHDASWLESFLNNR